MANVAPLLPGDPEWLGAYRLVGRLGQGGQGTVYLAQPPYGPPVAVKLLRAEWTRDPVARARFAREVAAVGRVAPFCTARILDARLDGDQPFVVSEFIDGPSLQAVVATQGPLAGSALDRLAVATATALSAIHQAGVIHRDLKPANVLLGPDGVRVIDFGIARSADASATLTSQLFGTPGYMAPEVVRGEPAGPPADVFAWAATITFAATGNPPFHAPNMAAIIHQLTQGEPDLGALSGYLRGIVAECIAKDPAARPAAVDLLMRLLQHSQRDGLATEPPGFRQPGRPTVPMPGQPAPAGAAAMTAPPRQGWEPQGPPGPAWAASQPVPPPGTGYPMRQGEPAPRRPGGHAVAGWAVTIAGLAVLCVLGGLLVPRLMPGRPPAAAPGAHASAPARTAGKGHQPARAAPPAPDDTIPAWFAGTWDGVAHQANGVVTQWAATLVLPEGATTGTFSISTIQCHARVTVTHVTSIRIVLSERLDANPSGKCAASGVISLDRTGMLRARMFWEDASDPANVATGVLIRT